MTTTASAEPIYLGIEDGWHRWSDGTRLPVLLGFDTDEPGDEEEEEDADNEQGDGDDTDDEDEEEEPANKKRRPDHKKPKAQSQRPERQAARYRVERNQARQERDNLRAQVAFLKAAGGAFIDADAAWKLADRSLLTVGDDGSVDGADDAVAALIEDQPFLLAPEPDGKPEPNPFKPASASGRTFNKKKVPADAYDLNQLQKKFPALRRGR